MKKPDELAILRAAVEKKCQPGTALDEKGMRRLQGFLLRRGFSYGDISHVLEEMNITCERKLLINCRILAVHREACYWSRSEQ